MQKRMWIRCPVLSGQLFLLKTCLEKVFLLTSFAADFNHFNYGSVPSQDTNSSQMRVAVGEDMKVFGGFTDFTKPKKWPKWWGCSIVHLWNVRKIFDFSTLVRFLKLYVFWLLKYGRAREVWGESQMQFSCWFLWLPFNILSSALSFSVPQITDVAKTVGGPMSLMILIPLQLGCCHFMPFGMNRILHSHEMIPSRKNIENLEVVWSSWTL